MRTRILLTVIIALALLFCLMQRAGESGGWVFRGIQTTTSEHLDDSLTNTLVAYGVARALNAAISVLQESEIDISPAGLGVTVAAGQVLDPLNDIIERFSWLLLACATSLGVQRILLTVGVQVGSGVLLPIALAFALAAVWAPRVGRVSLRRIATTIMVASLLIIFAVPMITSANRWVYDTFLADEYEASMEVVRASKQELAPDATATDALDEPGSSTEPNPDSGNSDLYSKDKKAPNKTLPGTQEKAQEDEDRSFFESIRDALSGEDEATNLRGRIDALRTMLDEAMDSIVNLIVIFVLNSVIFPLVFLWALVAMVKRLGRIVSAGVYVENK